MQYYIQHARASGVPSIASVSERTSVSRGTEGGGVRSAWIYEDGEVGRLFPPRCRVGSSRAELSVGQEDVQMDEDV